MKTRQKYLLVTTRVLFGLLFLISGVEKLLRGFTAKTYLEKATFGPFISIFQGMAGTPIVDFLVVWGEIAIGIALITGLFLWLTAFSGSLMMLLFYFSQFPPKTGMISYHIIYIFVFFLLAAYRAGEFGGIGWVRKMFKRELVNLGG